MTNRPSETAHTPIALLPRGFDGFDRLVRQVPASAWDNATPDTEWTVHDLVNHMVGEHLWAPRLLAGETVADIGDEYEGDVIKRLFGGDAVVAWTTVSRQSRDAWAKVSDPAMPVQLSRGPTPAEEYATEMLTDLVVHGWDLARGAGLDETGDPDAIAYVLEMIETEPTKWLGSGMFDAPVLTDSTDPLTRLVALLGRRP